MAFGLYDASVANFFQTLGAMSGVLDKSLAHFRERGVGLEDIVETSLAPDMLPFRFQIVSVVHHSRGAVEAAQKGLFTPPIGNSDLDYGALQKLVAEARDELAAFKPEAINSLLGREVIFQLGDRKMPFTAEGFLMSFSLPNFYFHATTAYDILRHKGAPLGKRDFMGRLRLKS
jgi:hypothetical protein